MAPLAFCAVLITLGTRSEFAQCKAGYCLVRRSAAEAEGLATGAARARRWCRLAVCGFLSFQRVSLVLYYVDVSSQMMGTADGSRRRVRRATTLQSDARRRPFNLMLNALAMVFILDLDDLILFDMCARSRPGRPARRVPLRPNANFFGYEEPRLKARFERRAAAAQAALRGAYDSRGAASRDAATAGGADVARSGSRPRRTACGSSTTAWAGSSTRASASSSSW